MTWEDLCTLVINGYQPTGRKCFCLSFDQFNRFESKPAGKYFKQC